MAGVMGTILTSLLPGIRQLRAPLAAGYLWLIALWLLVRDNVSNPQQATGLIADIYEMTQAAGRVAVGVALTFLAFLIGTIAGPLTRPLGFAYTRYVTQRRQYLKPDFGSWTPPRKVRIRPETNEDPVNAPLLKLMLEHLEHRLDRDERFRTEVERRLRHTQVSKVNVSWTGFDEGYKASLLMEDALSALNPESRHRYQPGLRIGILCTVVNIYDYWSPFVKDVAQYVPQRLLGKEPELYATYDRYRAEAEFRLAIVPPLMFSIAILAVQLSPIWLLGWSGCYFLLALAYQSRRDAIFQLAQFLASERIESPTLKELSTGPVSWRDEDETRGMLERPAFGG